MGRWVMEQICPLLEIGLFQAMHGWIPYVIREITDLVAQPLSTEIRGQRLAASVDPSPSYSTDSQQIRVHSH